MSERSPDQLGSLAQSARKGNLSQARGILIAIGVLTIVGYVIMYFINTQELEDLRKAGVPLDEEKVSEIMLMNYMFMGLGFVFIALGILVYRIPVAATLIGLILYIAGNIFVAVQDPENIRGGWIIKIIIIVCLVKAVQAAIAYEREAANENNPPKLDF